MTIAFHIKSLSKIHPWQFILIQNLLKSSTFKILLIIGCKERKKNTICLINKLIISPLLNIQYFLEKKLLNLKTQTHSFSEDFLFKNSIKIDVVTFESGINTTSLIQKKDTDNDYNIDIILKLQNENYSDNSLLKSKFGTWSITNINKIGRLNIISFYEFLSNKNSFKIDILSDNNKSITKINTIKFNSYFSIAYLNELITGTLPVFIQKALLEFQTQNVTSIDNNLNSEESPYHFIYFSKYLLHFYFNFFKKTQQSLYELLFKKRFNKWSLFIGKGSVLNIKNSNLQELIPPQNQFWADPFLFSHNDQNFVFFENYDYKKKKGVISCGELTAENKIDKVRDVLSLEYHLSYPYVYREGSNIFMIPETSDNKRLEIYISIDFPDKWELYSTGFEGHGLCDTFIHKDDNNNRWLFTNKSSSLMNNYNVELYIYKIDSSKLNKIIPHKRNPVILDTNFARNAGSIFKFQDKIVRPSQQNINGVYGYGINLRSIDCLSINEYVESSIKEINPTNIEGFNSVHHLNTMNDIYIIDGVKNN